VDKIGCGELFGRGQKDCFWKFKILTHKNADTVGLN
jgi:hypothetical protein